MKCPQCDRIIPDGAAECPYCGIIIQKFVQRETPATAVSAKKPGRGRPRIRVSAADEAWHKKQARQRFAVAIVVLGLLIVAVGYLLRPTSKLSVVTLPAASAPQKKEVPDRNVVAVTLQDMIARFIASDASPRDIAKLDGEQRRVYDRIRDLVDSQRFGEAADIAWDVLQGPDRNMMRQPAMVHVMGRAFVAAGVLLYRFKLWHEAYRYLDAARVCVPDRWFYYKYLGVTALALGRETDGRRFLMRYLTHRGGDSDVLHMLMYLSLGMERYKLADRYAQKILSLQSGDPAADELHKLLKAVMSLPEHRRPARTDAMEVPGFRIHFTSPLPYGIAAAFGETLSDIRQRTQKTLGLAELPVIDISFRDTEVIRDFSRSLSGCSATGTGAILIPGKGFHPSLGFVRDALLNTYVQAVLQHVSGNRIPCWISYGIAAWVESRNGADFPQGGMHNLPTLLSMKTLEKPKHLLAPNEQSGYYGQCYAAAAVIIGEQGIGDVMNCVATVRARDWQASFEECIDMNNDDIMEALMSHFGGRLQ